MTFRTLLLSLDQQQESTSHARVAIQLAKALDCHLVGLAPTGVPDLSGSTGSAASLADVAGLAWDTLRRRAEHATADFVQACHAMQLGQFEAKVDLAEPVTSLLSHARCHDLTVLRQADPQAQGHRAAEVLVEQVLLQSARPVLIVPCSGHGDSVGSNVLVVWNDSREAARVVSDALPLLRSARRVTVVRWRYKADGDLASLQRSIDDLQQWLKRHGISAQASIESSPLGIAQAILSRAAELDADLVVMGAYGHSRLAERVWGGASLGVLQSATVPVFMSH